MDKDNDVYAFVKRKISILDADTPHACAARAKLRRAVGKLPNACPDIWDITISEAPERWDSNNGKASREELAVHTALTLYALHRQSKDESMNADKISFGAAACMLKHTENSSEEAITRRFNAVATSVDFTELAYHARGLISLFKAKGIKMDYPRFASDLFWFQFPEYADDIRLRWGEDFYKYYNSEGSNE